MVVFHSYVNVYHWLFNKTVGGPIPLGLSEVNHCEKLQGDFLKKCCPDVTPSPTFSNDKQKENAQVGGLRP